MNSPRRSRRPRTVAGAVILALAGAAVLSGCAAQQKVDPAPDAADPGCSEVMLALPQEIDGMQRRTTTSQSTAAWGDPISIVLRCGTEDPGPTNDPCTTVGGVDWVAHQNDTKDSWTLTAYGRTPGVQVTLDLSKVSSATVAGALRDPVQYAHATMRCKAPQDVG